ncbi:MAG: nickel pincer cofactor biosynthesis protein LarB [Eubacteriales bacterium]|nr:nickel pincer cofactor biosynthesis protein LarB [Eubacteriales bacterium]
MEEKDLRILLEQVADGSISAKDAAGRLKIEPFNDIGIAKLDTHRGIRQGVGEVIYGASKTPEQIDVIAHSLYADGQETILITRMSAEAAAYFHKDIPFEYNEAGHTGVAGKKREADGTGTVLVITGGTSDIPVAEEAAETLEAFGNSVKRIYDAGVAGIHRLLNFTEDIMSASVIIAIAGMEGALASVVGGLADCPVIAVPTSVGYGTSFGGVTALLSMLNSCASGVTVVNIDNGFGAAYTASMINHMERKGR